MKSRLLRIAAILLGVLLFAGFFAFSTFFYSPFEGDLKEDVAALVPRDVDFFAGKSELSAAFSKFPHLAIEEQLLKHPAWQAWAASPEGKQIAQELKIEETLKTLEAQVSELPLHMQPLEIYGGKNLVVAGYFKGRELAQADWALYGRTNWLGKLGAALLRHPGLLGLEKRGLKVNVTDGHVVLSGGGLPRELFIGRVKDVVIVATKPEFVKAANDLAAAGYQDSFFQSANYNDWIQNAKRGTKHDEIELYVNTRKLLENLGMSGPWPNPKSQDLAPALLGRLFQLPALKNAMGVLGTDGGLQLDLHGEFSAEQITGEMAKVYRTHGFDKRTFEEVARLAPKDTGLFAYLHAPVAEFLRMILASIEPAMRQNLEDAFRNTGSYPNLGALVNELDQAFKDRWAMIVRPNDYPPDPTGPPHNDVKVPAVALVLWAKNPQIIDNLQKLIGGQGVRFGLQGRNKNEPGYFSNSEAGYKTYEFWSQFVDGTGVVVMAKAGEMIVITNSLGMMGHLLKTYSVGGDKYPRLSEEPRFGALVQSSIDRANLAVWLNPRTVTPVLRESAQQRARSQIKLDYASLRPPEETKVLREDFGGKRVQQLTEEEKQRLDQTVDEHLDRIKAKTEQENVPLLMQKEERILRTFEASTGALFFLALDPKNFDLSGRMIIPLEEKAAP